MRAKSIVLIALLAVVVSGCSRERYRLRADSQSYGILHQKTACAPWHPAGLNIDPPAHSRLAHNSCPDDPSLPTPSPSLYEYELPETQKRDPRRFQRLDMADNFGAAFTRLANRTMFRLPSRQRKAEAQSAYRLASHSGVDGNIEVAFLPLDQVPETPSPDDVQQETERVNEAIGVMSQNAVRQVPLQEPVWSSIPPGCLMRALEFSSITDEYRDTFGRDPSQDLFDEAGRLSLEDLIDLAVLNSREYQSQKENLYRAALALTLQRYDYQLKFSPFGNGTDVDYNHSNQAGITTNQLGIASGAAVEKVMSTGGQLLASFANDIVLTFNGPSGFATDVSSQLFAQISQPLLQRDRVFENLTQAERDVVYAARDYARFRKQFFRDIASDYYRLLLTYRSIEIDMLDYFTNQRGFARAQSEYALAQRIPRFQVDQFEQNAFNSRSRVIRSCNDLEQSFDQLKLRLGIPPETPINLDLTELEILTARDEVTVAIELARRSFRNLSGELDSRGDGLEQVDDRVLVVNAAIQLAQKLQAQLELQATLENGIENLDDPMLDMESGVEPGSVLDEATKLLNRLQAEAIAIQATGFRKQLEQEMNSPRPPLPTKLFFLRMNLIGSLLELGRLRGVAFGQEEGMAERSSRLAERYNALSTELDGVYQRLSEPDDDELTSEENVRKRTDELARVAEISDSAGELLTEVSAVVPTDEQLDASGLVREVLRLGDELQRSNIGGLEPIEINTDEAMLTALVTRFDLMNERGNLADAWRQIKLAGDDLRSILNLQASQTIRTDSTRNEAFDFTFDDSDTNVRLTFDAPLNRRAQRNSYRIALINYNVALRNLMQAEDQIKFAIRSDIRSLQLDREQYLIAVASAALASDRRLSTRKQLDEGLGNITARDFLEAQTAYTASLNGVASAHIDYILDRIDLFLDLELLQVDDSGFWPDLYDEQKQPEARLAPPSGSGPAYGSLVPGLHYSHCIRRMDCIPFGAPLVFDHEDRGAGVSEDGSALEGGPSVMRTSPDRFGEDAPAEAPEPFGVRALPEYPSANPHVPEVEWSSTKPVSVFPPSLQSEGLPSY